MKKLSTQPEGILEQLLSKIQTEEEHQLFLTYREIQHLHKEISLFADDSMLSKLLHITEIEAYDHLQKTIKEREQYSDIAATVHG